MAREFIDEDLLLWSVHSSTGSYSLPGAGRLIFHCITHPDRRPRAAPFGADLVETSAALGGLSDAELRNLLQQSQEMY